MYVLPALKGVSAVIFAGYSGRLHQAHHEKNRKVNVLKKMKVAPKRNPWGRNEA